MDVMGSMLSIPVEALRMPRSLACTAIYVLKIEPTTSQEMNGIVAQYWSIIPGGIHQVLHEPITGVDSFDVFGIEECSSADWNAKSGVNTLNMSQHCLLMNANSKQ